MKTMFALMLATVLVGLAVIPGWAQTAAAPPAGAPTTQAPSAAPAAPPGGSTNAPSGAVTTTPDAVKPSPAPGQPGPSATAPGTNVPATPPGTPSAGDPAAAGDGRIFGLSRGAAILIGIVILAVIIGLIAMSGRRRTDIAVESRTDIRPMDEPGVPGGRTTYESEIERERRRRAS